LPIFSAAPLIRPATQYNFTIRLPMSGTTEKDNDLHRSNYQQYWLPLGQNPNSYP